MRLTKRQGVYYVSYYEHLEGGGKRRRKRSTACTDRAAAEALGRQWEREGANPALARARGLTLSHALELLVEQREEQARAGARSADTAAFYAAKSGPLLRELGADYPLARLSPAEVDRYVSTRRAQWADDARTRRVKDSTIAKELTALRAALRLCARRGLWRGDLEPLFPGPSELSGASTPRDRVLSTQEALLLLLSLRVSNHVAIVAFALATGAEWRAITLAQRGDVAPDRSSVRLRGTKSVQRDRVVPIVASWQRGLLDLALDQAEGAGALLFAPWTNPRRDLGAALARAGCAAAGCPRLGVCGRGACRDPEHAAGALPRASPHDLRRTFGTWLRAGGLPPDLVGLLLGHRDGRMAERVYARLSPSELSRRVAAALGPPVGQTGRTGADSADDTDAPASSSASEFAGLVVPRDGIEPPTRGFSVPILSSVSRRNYLPSRTGSRSAAPPVCQPSRARGRRS